MRSDEVEELLAMLGESFSGAYGAYTALTGTDMKMSGRWAAFSRFSAFLSCLALG